MRQIPLARLFCVLVVLAAAPVRAQPADAPRPRTAAGDPPRNVVFMIADGFGPASETLARAAHGRPLALDAILTGSVSTAASDSRVTDSAAGATAYACGIKTYNGAIAVDASGAPCLTVLEAARDAGFATGLVATSRVTHATPASYASHVARRSSESEIAVQMAGARLDVLFGGGGRHFTPAAEGGRRTDGRDLRREMLGQGALVTTTPEGFRRLPAAPAVALLAADHMDYEIDRTDQPSLAEMALKALDLLAATPAARERGFFLMVEGSRIDHAAHANDAPAHVRDILAYDAAVAAVVEWARRDGATLVVSTADHETGGLALGRDGVYSFDPAPLLAATSSAERLAERLGEPDANPAALVHAALGADSLTAVDAARLAADGDTPSRVALFRDIEDHRAGIAWSTDGHTGVDVGLYAFGPGSERFRGHMASDAVGRATFTVLGLPLPLQAQAAADRATAEHAPANP